MSGALGLRVVFLGSGSRGNAVVVTDGTILRALLIAAILGLLSGAIPSFNAARLKVVDALRHTG